MAIRQILQAGDISRVRYALRLASAPDVATLDDRAAGALWRGHRRFMTLPPGRLGELPGIRTVNARGESLPPSERVRVRQIGELRAMQDVAREQLERASAGRPPFATMKGEITIDGDQTRFRGSPVETFGMTLVWLLSGPAGARVRKCPECGRFFLRVRRQIYCSDRCTDRATWRKYPEHKKRRARRKQYERHGWKLGARRTRRAR